MTEVPLRGTAPRSLAPCLLIALAALPACLETHERRDARGAPPVAEPDRLPPICDGFRASSRTRLASVLGSHVQKHDAPVNALALTPDGRLLLSAANDSRVKVWDVATGRELRTFTGHEHDVLCVAVSSDGKLALSGSDKGSLELWEVADANEVRALKAHEGEVAAVAFLPRSAQALSAGKDGKLVLWDLETGEPVRTWEKTHPYGISALAVSPSGEIALTGGHEGKIEIHEVSTGRWLGSFSGHVGRVASIAFCPDGWHALSAGDDHTVRAWDLSSGRELAKLPEHEGRVLAIAISPDGNRAVSASMDALRVWDLAAVLHEESRLRVAKLPGHGRELRALAFLPRGEGVFSGCADGTIELWDLERGISLDTGHRGQITCLSARGDRVLTGSDDHAIRLWSSARGNLLRELKGHREAVTAVLLTPDREHALSSSSDGEIKLWDLQSGAELWTRKGPPPVTALALSPDGFRYLAGSSSPSGQGTRHLVLGTLDRMPRVSDVALGPETREFGSEKSYPELTAIAFSPDGKSAFTGGSSALEIWSVETGRIRSTLEKHEAPIDAVAVSSDGRHALTGSRDHAVVLWDLVELKAAEKLKGHDEAVTAVAFSPDSKLALSASRDRTIRIWDLATESQVDSIDLSSSGDTVTSLAFTDERFFVAGTTLGAILRFELLPRAK